jgi:MinD-like ATPase involved in chromosome partitioning or flagellar assembly
VTEGSDARLCILVLAGGAGWESAVLPALEQAGVIVAKRCVDVPDLMASASAGQAAVAVVSGDLPRLDAEAIMHLLRYDVRTLAVTADPALADRMHRLGVVETVSPGPVEVVAAVRRVAARDVVVDPEPLGHHVGPDQPAGRGRVICVWGPAGAPGRTTVAIGLAAELAAMGRPVVLVDADPYGGTVAQHLGILDEMSGVLAVSRMANTGTLDTAAFGRSCRRVGERLDVLTGLPRADRRIEVRPDVFGAVLDVAAGLGDVVVDSGFCLEDDEIGAARDRMTFDALGASDEVVVVGSAEPTGLARLARGLVELGDVVGNTPVRVVVNRMRGTLGWSERDIVGMIEGYVRPVAVHFLPEDQATLDRALVAGQSLVELGESRLRAGLVVMAEAMFPSPVARVPAEPTRGRRRVRRLAQAPKSR